MPEDRNRHVLARINADLTRSAPRELLRLVPLLAPESLHALVVQRGLHDSGELLALATPQQLSEVFDLDLWKADRAGGDEHFDGARFCEWLEVLVDAGAAAAAARLVQIDLALVVAGFSSSIKVADLAVFSPVVEPDGADPVSTPGSGHDRYAEIGGYLVVARRPEAWEAILDVLRALEEHHPDAFDRVMHACRTLSNCGREVDGLDGLMSDTGQLRFDLAVGRERRRERHGFVTPEHARAFLDASRRFSFMAEPRGGEASPHAPQALQLSTEAAEATWVEREQEFAFIANALVAGCSILGRPFARREAIDAVTATCNLGIAHWPTHWAPASEHRVTTLFQAGWTLLHRDVSMVAAAQLLEVLETMRPRDRDARFECQLLARELRKYQQAGTPWRVRRLDVLAQFDLLACAALGALLGECPVMLANVSPETGRRPHTVDPSKFQLIADGRHIVAVHAFLRSIPELLA